MTGKFWGCIERTHSVHIGINTDLPCSISSIHCGPLWQHAGGRGETTYLPIFCLQQVSQSIYTPHDTLTSNTMCPKKRKNKEDEPNNEVERLRERQAALDRENEILEEEIQRGERDAEAYRRNMNLLREYWQARGGPPPPPSGEEEEEDKGRDDTREAGEGEEKRA